MNPTPSRALSCHLLALALSLGLSATAQAATLTVKQTGCGSKPNCYATISAAIDQAVDGDTVEVTPGTYQESLVISKGITLSGAGPQPPKLASRTNGIEVKSTLKEVTISGLIITAAQHGIALYGDTNSTIRNTFLIGNGKAGIFMNANNGVNRSLSAHFNNNTIVGNGWGGVVNVGMGSYPNYFITSCIISDNKSEGGISDYYGNGVRVFSSNLFNNTDSGNNVRNYLGITVSDTKSEDPMFVDPDTGNYALQAASPCRNTGTVSPVALDPDGSRNDMGAYGGPGASAFWPYHQGGPIVTLLKANPIVVSKGNKITITATAEVK